MFNVTTTAQANVSGGAEIERRLIALPGRVL